ncbi:CrcB family protein [Prochlorococcus sp. MIT 1223]|uniref:fluoride efflux transporter FluC n=1 Tax=Prochlorococcus sp. MIT 1223 TaxID=3096217 RepID=UPI002A75DA73|nr:CrcB family protein [Prochlorococcus sp. MIT 1223]
MTIGSIPGALIRWHVGNDFLVNIIGAFILGFIFGFNFRMPSQIILGIGFCGALTTFSSWMLASFQLIHLGNFFEAFTFIVLPILFGLLFASSGYLIGLRIKSYYLEKKI